MARARHGPELLKADWKAMMDQAPEPPSWFVAENIKHVLYAEGYRGWVVDCLDGTCRYANEPGLGCDDPSNPNRQEINRMRPHWGDRVRWNNGMPDQTQIVERWEPERYDENGDLKS